MKTSHFPQKCRVGWRWSPHTHWCRPHSAQGSAIFPAVTPLPPPSGLRRPRPQATRHQAETRRAEGASRSARDPLVHCQEGGLEGKPRPHCCRERPPLTRPCRCISDMLWGARPRLLPRLAAPPPPGSRENLRKQDSGELRRLRASRARLAHSRSLPSPPAARLASRRP